MHFLGYLSFLSVCGLAAAARFDISHEPWRRSPGSHYREFPRARALPIGPDNPFFGRKLTANPQYATNLGSVQDYFVEEGDVKNAAKVETIQTYGTFFWISLIDALPNIDAAIAAARSAKNCTGIDQIVGLVVYNVPDRDCSGGQSGGELSSDEGGVERYKKEYITPMAKKLASAPDVNFALVVEPDAVANIITNTDNEFCAQAVPVYEESIAYAIANLQLPNVHLYLDASNGGWIGWEGPLQSASEEFAKIVKMARSQSSNSTKVRGFSTNVSNFNPFQIAVPPPYTEGSDSYDESHFTKNLSPHLENWGLPSRFIVDQSRVALPGAREEWGEWCNVHPSGFGMPPGTPVFNNTHIDSIVWVKPGGESDGECGYEGAPPAGQWFPEYAAMLVENASPLIK